MFLGSDDDNFRDASPGSKCTVKEWRRRMRWGRAAQKHQQQQQQRHGDVPLQHADEILCYSKPVRRVSVANDQFNHLIHGVRFKPFDFR